LGPSHRHPLPTEGQPSPAHQARGGSCQPGGLHTSRAVAARQVTRARRGRFPRRRAGRGASSDGQSECCLRLKSVSAPWHPRLVRLFLANGDVNFLVGPCALHGDAHEHWTDCRRLTRCCKCYCCRLRRFAAQSQLKTAFALQVTTVCYQSQQKQKQAVDKNPLLTYLKSPR
jgi:hypothetical protein